jgi:hypothetical protein
VSKNKSKYDRASSVVAAPGAPSSSSPSPPSVQPSCGGWGTWGGLMDGDHVLRPLARGVVSLREHLNPTGRPPSARCLWSSRSTQDGLPTGRGFWSSWATQDGPPSGRLRLRVHWRCHRQRLPCMLCCVVEVCHHRVLLLLRRLGPDARGSCQLCTTNIVGGVAEQVVKLKLQWRCPK